MDDLAVAVDWWMVPVFVASLTIGYAIRSLISRHRRARAARYRVGSRDAFMGRLHLPGLAGARPGGKPIVVTAS